MILKPSPPTILFNFGFQNKFMSSSRPRSLGNCIGFLECAFEKLEFYSVCSRCYILDYFTLNPCIKRLMHLSFGLVERKLRGP